MNTLESQRAALVAQIAELDKQIEARDKTPLVLRVKQDGRGAALFSTDDLRLINVFEMLQIPDPLALARTFAAAPFAVELLEHAIHEQMGRWSAQTCQRYHYILAIREGREPSTKAKAAWGVKP